MGSMMTYQNNRFTWLVELKRLLLRLRRLQRKMLKRTLMDANVV